MNNSPVRVLLKWHTLHLCITYFGHLVGMKTYPIGIPTQWKPCKERKKVEEKRLTRETLLPLQLGNWEGVLNYMQFPRKRGKNAAQRPSKKLAWPTKSWPNLVEWTTNVATKKVGQIWLTPFIPNCGLLLALSCSTVLSKTICKAKFQCRWPVQDWKNEYASAFY